ncbi:MAG TPA: hypothetical protein VHY08_17095 [Bacillota bacterium]|nr:hypothetical protein [Bacillota bacterium]
MKKNRWFRYLLLAAIISLLVVGLSTTYGGTVKVDKNFNSPGNPNSNDEEEAMDEISKLFSSSSKKNDTESQIRTVSSQDQTNELRYLLIGNMDQELSLVIKLVDKAKLGVVNSQSMTTFLRQRQARNNRTQSLQKQIDNLVYELCILDMGKSTRRDLLNYINRIDYNDSGFNIMLDNDANVFNSILDLIRYNVLSPTEAIDSLIILKSKLRG